MWYNLRKELYRLYERVIAMTALSYFREICCIPHGSGNTGMLSRRLADFASERKLRHIRDEAGNVVIYKDASPGRENEEPIILQAHIDMVCVKDEGVLKDLKTEPLSLKDDGEWIWAEGTSLGGDDGIGAAMIMSILSDNTVSHPPVEAVFTVDEEIGMLGSKALDFGLLKGRRMISLDHGNEKTITVSCAGGLTAGSFIPCKADTLPSGYTAYRINVSGLLGGHSGGMISYGRANAILLLAGFLRELGESVEFRLCSFNGGTAQNVIPFSASAVIAVPSPSESQFESFASESAVRLKGQWPDEKGFTFDFSLCETPSAAISSDDSVVVCNTLTALPNGMRKMMEGFDNIARQSSNLGTVQSDENGLRFVIMIRSPYKEEKSEIADEIISAVSKAGGRTVLADDYPGWEYKKNSPLQKAAADVYRKLDGTDPLFVITHGGLEIGFFDEKIKDFDCISIGPTMDAIHSSKERLNLPSVDRAYKRLVALLEEI